MRDVLEGEDQIKDKRSQYLPKPKAQDPEQYRRYIDRAMFYAVAERTVRGLVGLVFRIAPMLELPERLESFIDSATPDASPIETLLRDAVREVTSLGRFGLLVDMRQQPALAGEAVPFIAPYEAEAIWRWDEVLDPLHGKRKLVRVIVEEDPATHGSQAVTWLRELFLEKQEDPETGEITGIVYKQQLWRDVDSETRAKNTTPLAEEEAIQEVEGFERVGDPIVPLFNAKTMDTIPFWFINTFNLQPKPAKPPMLDLANMNIAHYRNSADYEQLLHLVGSPTIWVAANWEESPKPVHVGAGASMMLPQGATVGVLEFSGQSATAFERSMDQKEERMAALGARLIRNQERANVTAETTKLQAGAETSVLTNVVQNVELAFTLALKFAAEWAGASETEVEDIRIELNKDFFGLPLTPAELKELVAGWQSGAYSRQTLHENLQKGEIIDPKRTLEDELALIEEELPEAPLGLDTGLEDESGLPEEPVSGDGASSVTGPGGSDNHEHAIEGGAAVARTPGGRALDHEHSIAQGASATGSSDSENTGTHSHSL